MRAPERDAFFGVGRVGVLLREAAKNGGSRGPSASSPGYSPGGGGIASMTSGGGGILTFRVRWGGGGHAGSTLGEAVTVHGPDPVLSFASWARGSPPWRPGPLGAEQTVAGMGCPGLEGELETAFPPGFQAMQAMCACLSNQDATRFGVPGAVAMVGDWGAGPPLLWLPSWDWPLALGLHLPVLLPAVLPVLSPSCSPPTFLLTCPGSGVSSFLPAQGQGVAVGRKEGTPLSALPGSLLPRAPHTLPRCRALPGALSLGCPLPLPFQQVRGLGSSLSHLAPGLVQGLGGAEEVQLGVSWHSAAPLLRLAHELAHVAWVWLTPGPVPLRQLQTLLGLGFPGPSPRC